MESFSSNSESSTTGRLLSAVADGQAQALETLLAEHRAYIRRVVDVRVEPALRARIDPSDIVQDTLVVASRRIQDFLERRPTSFRLWLRRHAMERLIDARRKHMRHKRDAMRDVPVNDASSMAIAGELLGNRPSEHIMRHELIAQVRNALEALSEADREILMMRHGEQLSGIETAELLGISPDAASKRYGRAVARMVTELRRLGVTRSN
jgi:RNA polymerase sigma-70 factor (ECF subfamily)